MAEFTHKDLKIVRESRKITKWQMANELGVSEDTVYRWEKGEQRPDPDIIGNVKKFLNYPGLWHKWMMSHYDSYRERYADVPDVDSLTGTVVRMKHEISDIMPLFESIERDTLNSEFNKPELWKRFKKEILEAVAAMQKTLDVMPDDF